MDSDVQPINDRYQIEKRRVSNRTDLSLEPLATMKVYDDAKEREENEACII